MSSDILEIPDHSTSIQILNFAQTVKQLVCTADFKVFVSLPVIIFCCGSVEDLNCCHFIFLRVDSRAFVTSYMSQHHGAFWTILTDSCPCISSLSMLLNLRRQITVAGVPGEAKVDVFDGRAQVMELAGDKYGLAKYA